MFELLFAVLLFLSFVGITVCVAILRALEVSVSNIEARFTGYRRDMVRHEELLRRILRKKFPETEGE